jgi:hypothetical protein
MGQKSSSQPLPPVTQRIRPTPGTTGRRNRKGSLSVYCEDSHSIYTIPTKPSMRIFELKKLLPNRNCELKIANEILLNSATIESLGIDDNTLVRMLVLDKGSQKSISTVDSEQDSYKKIGPKKSSDERPEKPNYESVSSIGDDAFGVDLMAYAVPDLQLEKSYAVNIKNPLY